MCWVGVGGKGLWCEEEQRCVCVLGGGGVSVQYCVGIEECVGL